MVSNTLSSTANKATALESKQKIWITYNSTCNHQSKRHDSLEEPVEDIMMYQALTAGSGTWEDTEDKHWVSSTAPQPCSRSWGGHIGLSPTILSPSVSLQPPCPLSASSSFSVCLPAFTGAVYRTGPQCPSVINGDYGADGFLPFLVVCCYAPLSFAFLPQWSRNPKTPADATAASWKLLHCNDGASQLGDIN